MGSQDTTIVYGKYIKPYICPIKLIEVASYFQFHDWGIIVEIIDENNKKIRVKSNPILIRALVYTVLLKPDKPIRNYIANILKIDLERIPVKFIKDSQPHYEVLLNEFDKKKDEYSYSER